MKKEHTRERSQMQKKEEVRSEERVERSNELGGI